MPTHVLITGASRGIGFAAARELVRRGAHVFLASRRLESATDAAARLGAGATPVALDPTDPASIAAAVGQVQREAGGLDVLVNNAAVLLDAHGTIFDLQAETLRATLEANLIGPLQVTQGFLPLLRQSDRPRVINVSSGAGQLDGGASVWAPAYSISKTALNMLTQQLSGALPGVAVNSICPGWCRTEMGGAEAPRTPEQGADTLVWLAVEAPQESSGGFWRDRQPFPW